MNNLSPQNRVCPAARRSDRLMWVDVDTKEREFLMLVRTMTNQQQKAFLKLLRAAVALRETMQDGQRDAA